MQNAVSGVLATIAKEVLNLEGGIKSLSKELDTLKGKLAIGGALGIAAGAGIFAFLGKAASDAKELSHQLANIQKLGMTPAQVAAAIAAANASPSQIPGTTTAGGLGILANINSIVGPAGALKMLQPLQKFGEAMGAQTGNYAGASETILKLVRSGDLLGKFVNQTTRDIDLDQFQRFLDLVAKVSAATHGMVKPETWLQLAQQGGPALASMSDEGLISVAMAAQAMGGLRVGTAMTSLYQQMIGGTMSAYRAGELQKLGLIGDFTVGAGGKVIMGPGNQNMPFVKAMQKDPLAAEKLLREAFEQHGYTTIDEQVPMLFKILQRATVQRLLHDFLRNEPQMLGERGRVIAGAGVEEQLNIANRYDYGRNLHNLASAWKELMTQVGLPITVVAIDNIQKLNAVLLKVAAFAHEHPNEIENIARGLGYLGAALIAGGGVAILAALGPAGWITVGITLLGGTMITYGATIVKFIEGFSNSIIALAASGLQKVVEWVKSFGNVIADLWNKIKSFSPISYGGGGLGGGGGGGGFGGGGGIINTSFPGGGGTGNDLEGAVAGSGALRQYLATGGHGMDPRTTAWCAAYVGSYLNHHGYQSLASNVATSYMNYGSPETEGVHAGDVVVYNPKGLRAGQTGAHVGIATGRVSGGRVEMLAGNSGHRVRREWESLGASVIRRPPPRHDGPIHNVMYLDGEVLHQSVVKRMVRGMTHPTTAPYHDGSRHWTPPDAGLVGV